MKKLGFAWCLLLLGSSITLAQSSTHRCEVSITDFNIDDKIKLGSFTSDAKKKEPLFTKSFQFPDTKLFVTASVLYIDPYAEETPPNEMILTLALSKKAYSAIEAEMKDTDVITNARARVPLKSFERAAIETIYLGKPEAVIIELECKK